MSGSLRSLVQVPRRMKNRASETVHDTEKGVKEYWWSKDEMK